MNEFLLGVAGAALLLALADRLFQRRAVRGSRREGAQLHVVPKALAALMDDAAKLVATDGQFDEQQRTLLPSVERISAELRGTVDPEKIQKVITATVSAWSEARGYGSGRPPLPTGLPLFPACDLPCRHCDEQIPVTKEGRCDKCGLFCPFWVKELSQVA